MKILTLLLLTISISIAVVFETSTKTTQPEVLYRIDNNGSTHSYSVVCLEGTKWLFPHIIHQSPQQIFRLAPVGLAPIPCDK